MLSVLSLCLLDIQVASLELLPRESYCLNLILNVVEGNMGVADAPPGILIPRHFDLSDVGGQTPEEITELLFTALIRYSRDKGLLGIRRLCGNLLAVLLGHLHFGFIARCVFRIFFSLPG